MSFGQQNDAAGFGNIGGDGNAGAVGDAARAGAGNMADSGFNNSFRDALTNNSSTPYDLGFGSVSLMDGNKECAT